MRREVNTDCENCGGTGTVVASVERTPFGPRLILGACHCVRWILDPTDMAAIVELEKDA